MQNVATLVVTTAVTVSQVMKIIRRVDLKPTIALVSEHLFGFNRKIIVLFHVVESNNNNVFRY